MSAVSDTLYSMSAEQQEDVIACSLLCAKAADTIKATLPARCFPGRAADLLSAFQVFQICKQLHLSHKLHLSSSEHLHLV